MRDQALLCFHVNSFHNQLIVDLVTIILVFYSNCLEVGGKGNSSSVGVDVSEDWNPMESDYLSSRNLYSVNDEDVGSALLGQSGVCYENVIMSFTGRLSPGSSLHSSYRVDQTYSLMFIQLYTQTSY